MLRRSQPFRALLLAFGLQGLASGAMLAGAQYVATWVLHDEAAVTFLFVALIGPALLVAPLWRVVAKRGRQGTRIRCGQRPLRGGGWRCCGCSVN